MTEDSDYIPPELAPLEVLQRLRHELKHPFNMIQGSTTLLSENESLDEEARKHVDRINTVAMRLVGLLEVLDDYLESKSNP
ncbi:MAG: hypothetical protein L0154_13905 [Chloroflexi bacterium]|nr:hypothetical protein [Chloroflexota bacterium]